MPTTPERAAFITQEFRRATSQTASAQTRHGDLARSSDDPVETFFDDVTDAQTIADARQALLSPERRLFRPRVRGIDEALALTYTSGLIPVHRYVDVDKGFDGAALTKSITIDFAAQQAEIGVWG